ncbi:hypothetical protein [Propionivibrio sp.]|uniref:hypothetical protein n=1 Tax=Propionivibrio sp. TaxID=2212460 RepID=UPI003BEFED74
MTSKIQQGQHYRSKALYLLARLGYASTRQIAKAIWGHCDISTRKMASRTLRRLLADGHVVERRDGDTVTGERMVGLTKSGALQLAHFVSLPGNCEHTRDRLRHAHSHRSAANSVYSSVAGDLLDLDIGWSELEIRAGDAPHELASFRFRCNEQNQQKIPDILFDFAGNITWVEVENNWRSSNDFVKLVAFLRAMFSMERPLIQDVLFVITAPGAKTIGDRLRAELCHNDPVDATPRQLRTLDAHLLAERIRVMFLDADSLELKTVFPIRESGLVL